MKIPTLVLLMIGLSANTYGQKDKVVIAEQTATIDSLTTALDAATKSLATYQGMYDAIQEKVIKYSFDPARTSDLIDSLRTSRDSTFSDLGATNTALSDSLSALNVEYAKLKELADGTAAREAEKQAAVNDLKELKDLLDQKILTQEEFDTRKQKLLEKL